MANADGTGAIQVANPISGMPRWSPDGRRLAFDSRDKVKGWNVWVMEANGGPARQLTHGPADNIIPSWSADGESIYFSSQRSGRFEIWRMPSDGGTAGQVTHAGGFAAFESPDGKTLYYTLSDVGEEGLYCKQLPEGAETQVVKDAVAARGFVIFSDGVYYLHPLNQGRYEIRFRKFAAGRVDVVAEIEGPLGYGLAVSPDRKRFLFTKNTSDEWDLKLIENFR